MSDQKLFPKQLCCGEEADLVRLNGYGSNRDMPRPIQSSAPTPETTTQNNPSSTYDNVVPALDIDISSDIDMENSLNAPAASTIVEPETGAPTQSRLSRTLPEEEQPIRSNQYKNCESTSVDQESIEHSSLSLRGSLKDIQAKMRLDNQRYQKANLVRLNGHGSNRDMPRPRQSSTRNMPRPSPYRREEHPSKRLSNRR